MKSRKFFPAILVEKHADGYEGLAGLKLKSILKGDLLLQQVHFQGGKSSPATRLDPEYIFSAREALLHSISIWLVDVTLELHITALPNLLDRSNGLLWITLFLGCKSADAASVKEKLVSRYLSLVSVLAAHLPESEYIPMIDSKELESRFRPFQADCAIALKRRDEKISLLAPLKKLSLGFGPIEEKIDDYPHHVQHRFPWFPSLNDGYKLISTLMTQLNPVQIIVRIKAMRSNPKSVARLDQIIRACEMFLSGSKKNENSLMNQAAGIRDISLQQLARLRNHCFKLGVFLAAPGKIDRSLGNVLGAAITGPSFGAEEKNFFRGGFRLSNINPEKVLNRRFFPEKETFTLTEAACAFCLPAPPIDECPGLPVKRSRTSLAWVRQGGDSGNDKIDLFLNDHQGMVKRVSMASEDRMRHTFIMGQTGTGKSALMETMILQDIRAGRGLAVLDPHGEMIDSIIGKVPEERVGDVVLLDLLDRERPLGFNLIQWNTLEERDLIVDELYMTLDRLYDMRQTGGPIFESNFRGMLKLLMGDKPRNGFSPTVLEFALCYLEKDFREWLEKSIADPQIQDFIKELERTRYEASLANLSPYITSKFSRFTSDTTLRRIIGQEKTSFDFEEIMNQGKILFVKLGKGRFGSTISALLANHLVSRFKLAAMKRAEMDYEERRDFYLYVDECHNLPSENFMELLAEARKYRMGLVLATQYSAQLTSRTSSMENTLLAAILGNVGAIIFFRLGQEDAIKIEPVLQPYFSSLDIIGLPNWHGYARIQMNNEAAPPFSFRTEKNETPYGRERATEIRNLSRLKYGTDSRQVDAQIFHRRTSWRADCE